VAVDSKRWMAVSVAPRAFGLGSEGVVSERGWVGVRSDEIRTQRATAVAPAAV